MATKPYKEMARYGVVGIDLVLAILICGGIGHWLDVRYFGNHGYGMLVGGLLGVAVGVRSLVRAAQRMQKDIEREEAKDPEGSRWTVDQTWLHKDEPSEPDHPAPPGPKKDEPPN
jgi:F0F1-type ATP synthase assembly protein I